jgi:hypothetical protein
VLCVLLCVEMMMKFFKSACYLLIEKLSLCLSLC